MAKEENKQQFSSIDIDGVKYKTLLTQKYKQRKKYVEKDPREVHAFIPGTISKIWFKQKKQVKEGDVILTLDAMKMLNKVMAPMDGELKLLVKQRDVVSKNQILFKILD